MYYEHFHLKEHPFRLTSDGRFFYEGPEQAHALSMLEYALIKKQGIMLLTGQAGCGKTMLLEHFLSRIDKTYPVLRFTDGALPELEFLLNLAQYLELNVEGQGRRRLLESIRGGIHAYQQQGKNVIIVVDDAHTYEPAVLADLAEFGQPAKEVTGSCTIYLVGSDKLTEFFQQPEIPTPGTAYKLKPLQENEIRQYIMHRLAVAGAKHTVAIDSDVYAAIQTYTGGCPRQINIMVDHLLTNAYLADESTISQRILEAAIKELQWVPHGLVNAEDDSDEVESAFLTEKRESYMIIITMNQQVQSEYSVHKKRINIGRHRSNDIRIDDPLISRLHAQIFRQGRIYYIRDMESKNGTYIDDKRIDIAPLRENTQVRLGGCTLTFIRQAKAVHSAA